MHLDTLQQQVIDEACGLNEGDVHAILVSTCVIKDEDPTGDRETQILLVVRICDDDVRSHYRRIMSDGLNFGVSVNGFSCERFDEHLKDLWQKREHGFLRLFLSYDVVIEKGQFGTRRLQEIEQMLLRPPRYPTRDEVETFSRDVSSFAERLILEGDGLVQARFVESLMEYIPGVSDNAPQFHANQCDADHLRLQGTELLLALHGRWNDRAGLFVPETEAEAVMADQAKAAVENLESFEPTIAFLKYVATRLHRELDAARSLDQELPSLLPPE